MTNISLKKHIINSLSNLSSDNNKLVFVTAAGIISGYLSEINDKSNIRTASGSMSMTAGTLLNDYEQNIQSLKNINENDGFILLRDVTIKHGMSTFSAPSFFLFYDQVIAVTIGNLGSP
jgi:hypothetical protein